MRVAAVSVAAASGVLLALSLSERAPWAPADQAPPPLLSVTAGGRDVPPETTSSPERAPDSGAPSVAVPEWLTDRGPVSIAQGARAPGPETISELHEEIVIVGEVTDAEIGNDDSGGIDEGLRPVSVTVRVETRITPTAQNLPDELVIRNQYLASVNVDGVRKETKFVEEGMPWLNPGDRIFTSLIPYPVDASVLPQTYGVAGLWSTFEIVDRTLVLSDNGTGQAEYLLAQDDDSPIQLSGLSENEAVKRLRGE